MRVALRVAVHPTGYLRSTVNRIVPDTAKLVALGWHADLRPELVFHLRPETLQA
jgi:hypothetical protein